MWSDGSRLKPTPALARIPPTAAPAEKLNRRGPLLDFRFVAFTAKVGPDPSQPNVNPADPLSGAPRLKDQVRVLPPALIEPGIGPRELTRVAARESTRLRLAMAPRPPCKRAFQLSDLEEKLVP